MRPYEAAEVSPPAPKATVAPAVDWKTALRMAFLRTVAVGAGLVTACGTGALLWLFYDYLEKAYLVGAGALALVGGTFALALWGYTNALRRALWELEKATNQDLDGDGRVGKPGRRRWVHLLPISAGGTPDPDLEAWSDDDDPEAQIVVLEGFELDVVDVAAFVLEAGRRGLSRRAWLQAGQLRYKLPSGQKVSRDVWDRITAEMVRLRWAKKDGQGLVLASRPAEIIDQLRDLIQ